MRVDAPRQEVFIGYGAGGLAVIDAARRQRIADIPLPAHPEGFELGPEGGRIFVNLPEARQIAVIDGAARRRVAHWTVPNARANFPMAVDAAARRVVAVFRAPPRLVAFDAVSGDVRADLPTCGDADDVFVDVKRGRLYVSCGEGAIEVFERRPEGYAALARIATALGARTALFAPERDRLYLAVPARGGEDAAIWIFRPLP